MFDDLKPHLVELRKRLAISVAAIIIMFFVMFNFHDAILQWITAPLIDALASASKISAKAAEGQIVTKDLAEAFFCSDESLLFCRTFGSTTRYFGTIMALYRSWAVCQ